MAEDGKNKLTGSVYYNMRKLMITTDDAGD